LPLLLLEREPLLAPHLMRELVRVSERMRAERACVLRAVYETLSY